MSRAGLQANGSELDWRQLPLHGNALIEASAGTGKTYTLVLLVLRQLLEREVAIEKILLSTFTEAATAELRQRVRSRLQQVQSAAERSSVALDLQPGSAVWDGFSAEDPLLDYLQQRWTLSSTRMRDRALLQRAVSGVSEMPIKTLHGFCLSVLMQFALIDADHAANAVDEAALDHEAIDDVLRLELGSLQQLRPSLADVLDDLWLEELRRVLLRFLKYQKIHVRAADTEVFARYQAAKDDWLESGHLLKLQQFIKQRNSELVETSAEALKQLMLSLLRCKRFGAFRCSAKYLREVSQLKAKKGYAGKHDADQLLQGARRFAQHALQLRIALRAEFLKLNGQRLQAVRLMLAERRSGRSFHSIIDTLAFHLGVNSDLSNATENRQRGLVSPGERGSALSAFGSGVLSNALHERYPVAMVDEFQDSDTTQFAILHAIYAKRGGLTLVGDPKQAIYRFRGSDVNAYLAASFPRYLLRHNFRSQANLIVALNRFYGLPEKPFGTEKIQYFPALIPASTKAQAGSAPALIITEVAIKKRTLEQALCLEAALHAAAARYHAAGNEAPSAQSASLGSVAVLVHTNAAVKQGLRRLAELGVEVSQLPELEGSFALRLILSALQALAEPASNQGLKRLSYLLGLPEINCESDLQISTSVWREIFRKHGLPALVERLGIEYLRGRNPSDAAELSLAACDDLRMRLQVFRQLRSVLELCAQSAVPSSVLTLKGDALVAALARFWLAQVPSWLQRRAPVHSAESRDQRAGNCESVRASDAAVATKPTVQVMTIHAAKGLEFDWVFLPSLGREVPKEKYSAVLSAVHGLEFDAGSSAFSAALNAERAEAMAEAMRLQYVALTRAKRQVEVFIAHSGRDQMESSLHIHLVSCADSVLNVDDERYFGANAGFPGQGDAASMFSAEPLWRRGARAVCQAYQHSPLPRDVSAVPLPRDLSAVPLPRDLSPAVSEYRIFDARHEIAEVKPDLQKRFEQQQAEGQSVLSAQRAHLDAILAIDSESVRQRHSRQNLSFSALHNRFAAHRAHRLAEPYADANSELHSANTLSDLEIADPALSPLNALRGKGFGIALHALLEQRLASSSDPVAVAAQLQWLRQQMQQAGVRAADLDPLHGFAEHLLALARRVWRFPIPEAVAYAAPKTLADLPRYKKAVELEFSFSVLRLKLPALNAVALQFGFPHLLVEPLQLIADQRALFGTMKGFVDLIFENQGRYFVLDYKGNWLGNTLTSYAAKGITSAMAANGYHLQYFLYALALHRYLRAMLPDYQFSEHFGGVQYWFVRAFAADPQAAEVALDAEPRHAAVPSLGVFSLRGARAGGLSDGVLCEGMILALERLFPQT